MSNICECGCDKSLTITGKCPVCDIYVNKEPKWFKEWPTEPGFYWFYGWPYKDEKERGMKPELNSVQVQSIPNGIMVIRSGSFWYKSEYSGNGMFIEAILPDITKI